MQSKSNTFSCKTALKNCDNTEYRRNKKLVFPALPETKLTTREIAILLKRILCVLFVIINKTLAKQTFGICVIWKREKRTAPSKTKDRMSSVSLLMAVESNSGTADARAAVTWPSTEVAARLSPLPNCSFMRQSFDSRILELGDCFFSRQTKFTLCDRRRLKPF